jgi:hypothetical protein
VPVNGGTTLIARAQVSANSPQEGFGAVTALVASLAARPTSGVSSLRLSNVLADGDVAALRSHADRIAAWWDARLAWPWMAIRARS